MSDGSYDAGKYHSFGEKLFIWVFFFWLMVPLKIITYFVIKAFEKNDERRARRRRAALDAKFADITIPKQDQSSYACVAVAANLYGAPSTPVERMRATIKQDSFPNDGRTTFSVTLVLELSEEERAIVRKHEIDCIEIDNAPAFTQQQLAEIQEQNRQELEAIPSHNETLRTVTVESMEQAFQALKKQRRSTTVGDLLVIPYQVFFNDPHEATQFANTLKTKYLPRVRALIDQYREFKASETIEF
jgi:hypothetical protein